MFNEHDRKYISESLKEAHKELGERLVLLVPNHSPDNVYEEDKFITYDKIEVEGLTLYNPTAEQLSALGLEKRANLVISIEASTLVESGVILSPMEELLKCKFIVGEDTYTIISVTPFNKVQGIPLVYRFESRC